ncbi:hypothetical protein ATCC90586_004708 [Pythium insidiosum]|nr:hypothetical protein ATCC90586_004708 [Pythium insidiosum]
MTAALTPSASAKARSSLNHDERKRIERRVKGRLQKQRFRQRQRERVETDRETLDVLEREHRALLHGVHERLQCQPPGTIDVFQRYLAVTHEIEALWLEGQQLRRDLAERERFAFTVLQTVQAYDSKAPGAGGSTDDEDHESEQLQPAAPFLLSAGACAETIERCEQEIWARLRDRAPTPESTNEIHGWRIHRDVQPSRLELLFTKRLSAVTPTQLADATWPLMTALATSAAPARDLDARVLQVVDSETVVLHKRKTRPQLEKINCANLLFFRRPTRNGRAVIIGWKSVHREAASRSDHHARSRRAPRYPEVWVDVFEWLLLEEEEEEEEEKGGSDGDEQDAKENGATGCRVTFGSRVEDSDPAYLKFLLTEMLVWICRWEHAISHVLQRTSTLPTAL